MEAEETRKARRSAYEVAEASFMPLCLCRCSADCYVIGMQVILSL